MTPLGLKTACILLGMLFISLCHVIGGILVYSFATLSLNSYTPVGGV